MSRRRPTVHGASVHFRGPRAYLLIQQLLLALVLVVFQVILVDVHERRPRGIEGHTNATTYTAPAEPDGRLPGLGQACTLVGREKAANCAASATLKGAVAAAATQTPTNPANQSEKSH